MHPILLQAGFFTLHTYWVVLAIGIIITTFVAIHLSIKNSLKLQFISEHALKLFLSALVGARLFGVLQSFSMYFIPFRFENLKYIFYFWDKQINLWGGLLFFLITLYFICKKKGQDFWKWFDITIPSFIILEGINSFAEFFEGTSYGKETTLPWGVNFESPAIKYTVPIHPVQIYAFLYSLIIGIVLIVLIRSHKFKTSLIGLSGIIAYSFFRFLETFIRGDDIYTIFWNIRIDQIIYPLILILASTLFYLKYHDISISSKLKKRPLTK